MPKQLEPTKEVTITFVDTKIKDLGDKQVWNFIDEDGKYWACWDEKIAEGIKDEGQSGDGAVKVEYFEKRNGKYLNKTIVDAWVQGKWVMKKGVATVGAPSVVQLPVVPSGADPKYIALEVAGKIMAAHIAKSEQAGNLSLHGVSTLNLANTLMTFFGDKFKAEPMKKEVEQLEEAPF